MDSFLDGVRIAGRKGSEMVVPNRSMVFISATSGDLTPLRKVARDALLAIDCHPVEQSTFPPDYRTVTDMLVDRISECDAVIHIVGMRYGNEPDVRTLPKGSVRRSFAQMELEIARDLGKRTYVFLCSDDFPYGTFAGEPPEIQALQMRYRRRIAKGPHLFTTLDSEHEASVRFRELNTHLDSLKSRLASADASMKQARRRGLALVSACLILIALFGTLLLLNQKDPGQGSDFSGELDESDPLPDDDNRYRSLFAAAVEKVALAYLSDGAPSGQADFDSVVMEVARERGDEETDVAAGVREYETRVRELGDQAEGVDRFLLAMKDGRYDAAWDLVSRELDPLLRPDVESQVEVRRDGEILVAVVSEIAHASEFDPTAPATEEVIVEASGGTTVPPASIAPIVSASPATGGIASERPAVPVVNLFSQPPSPLHPENVIGNGRCEECHKEELQAWKVSTHARSDSVHRDPKTRAKAEEIAKAMGIRSVNDIAAHPLCTECHFTRQKETTLKVIGGVSCESCHGGAKEWRDVHGARDKIADRSKRQELSTAAGMLYPDDTYAVATNCFNCHVVRDEELVVKGGHPARSEGFNLVSWSGGEVRHNFYTADYERVEDKNLDTLPHRKRMFLIVGMLLDLEYSVRGLANGKDPQGGFRKAMGTRAYGIINKEIPVVLAALGGDSAPAEIKEIAELAKGLNLSSPPAVMNKAADEIGAKAKAFSDAYDGTEFAGIDKLIPGNSKGTAWQP